jgi:hypothetical protein
MSYYGHNQDTEPINEFPEGAKAIRESVSFALAREPVDESTAIKIIDLLLANGWAVVPLQAIGRKIFTWIITVVDSEGMEILTRMELFMLSTQEKLTGDNHASTTGT